MEIWMLNHYATNMYYEGGGRHHWFAKYLIQKGYKVKIFCANIIHNSGDEIELDGALYTEKVGNDKVPYVFVSTTPYKGNGFSRIKNMYAFAHNVKKTLKSYEEKNRPDIIMASSVHPLTLLSALKVAKRFNIPCICEIRDLWPETLVAYKCIKENGLLGRMLYAGEKWIYKRADQLVFTMEGANDYIHHRGWEFDIKSNKVNYINNGIDLEAFEKNKRINQIKDPDLEDGTTYKVIYAGSIRKGNKVEQIINLASLLKEKQKNRIQFLIFGDGDYRKQLEKLARESGLDNVKFKGKVDKKYIPFILSKGDLNLLDPIEPELSKYGMSQNKLFEYIASGRPIISDMDSKYNIISRYNLGMARPFQSTEEYCSAIESFEELPNDEYQLICNNAKLAAQRFDFKKHTDSLIKVFNKCTKEV